LHPEPFGAHQGPVHPHPGRMPFDPGVQTLGQQRLRRDRPLARPPHSLRLVTHQFLLLSTRRLFPSHGIMPRSFSPTRSMRCSFPAASSLLKFGLPAWCSAIHSSANAPDWMSASSSRITRRVSPVMIRAPRVRSPYSAVLLTE